MAVQVHLVGPVTELLSLLEFVDDALVTSRGDESWEPVRALPALAEPADDRRRPKVNIYESLSEHDVLYPSETLCQGGPRRSAGYSSIRPAEFRFPLPNGRPARSWHAGQVPYTTGGASAATGVAV